MNYHQSIYMGNTPKNHVAQKQQAARWGGSWGRSKKMVHIRFRTKVGGGEERGNGLSQRRTQKASEVLARFHFLSWGLERG